MKMDIRSKQASLMEPFPLACFINNTISIGHMCTAVQHRPVELVTPDRLTPTQKWSVTQSLNRSIAKTQAWTVYL